MSNVVVYSDGELELKISVNEETIWLNQVQMSELFETSTDNISLHLKNIYKEKELDENLTVEDFSVVPIVLMEFIYIRDGCKFAFSRKSWE